ncbi:MAG: uracil phosphoribosyltransferase [Gammaproteobacteria bacterium]|nr:uracil phosphoribosyltransferase [Gammaproteobacteria bacterium]
MTLVTDPKFPNLYQVSHPLILHKLSQLRECNTSKKEFKELLEEITRLLVYEATKDLPLTTRRIQTPLETIDTPVLEGKKPVVLPILRAGLGMVDGFLSLIPSARVGHIGLFRNENTLQPELYYFKIPKDSQERHVFICDPMLATGGSVSKAIELLKERGVKRISFLCIVASPEGATKLTTTHPDVKIFTAHLDRQLNEKGYILPGLGDAGDRLFGTR